MRWLVLALLAASIVLATTASAAQPSRRPTDAERGKELYERHCLACHGALGAGDGPATTSLVFPVPDLQTGVEINEETVIVVLRGRETMPGFENAFDKFDARRVLRYMANLGKGTTPPPEEEGTEPADDESEAPGGDVPLGDVEQEDIAP